MEEIISAVSVERIKAELTPEKKLRSTNKSNNEIYIVTAQNAPAVMEEIGRLREIAFRYYGGGTGKSLDIDEYDTMENAYKQLVLWSPEDEIILGGYRFLCGSDVKMDANGKPILATSHLFDFSEKFIKEILPYTVELGRSFITLEYQSTRIDTNAKKALFVLDNLWDGLGALSVVNPDLKYYFGKVTMYNNYDSDARDMILYYLNKHYGDKENLVTPIYPLQTGTDESILKELFTSDNRKDDYRILNHEVRKKGINVPPLISAYMNLSPTMQVFGTAINHEFGEVEETGILITANDLFEDKKHRYIESFLKEDSISATLVKNG